jgi:hypothetical protein
MKILVELLRSVPTCFYAARFEFVQGNYQVVLEAELKNIFLEYSLNHARTLTCKRFAD